MVEGKDGLAALDADFHAFLADVAAASIGAPRVDLEQLGAFLGRAHLAVERLRAVDDSESESTARALRLAESVIRDASALVYAHRVES